MNKEHLKFLGGFTLAFLIFANGLICLVPFNFLNDLHPSFFSYQIPIHHIIFFFFGLWFTCFSIYFLYDKKDHSPFIYLSLLFLWALLISGLLTKGSKSESIQSVVGFLLRGVAPGMTAYVLTKYFGKKNSLYHYLFWLGGVVALASLTEPILGRYFIFERSVIPEILGENYFPAMKIAVGGIGQPLALSILLNMFLPISIGNWLKDKKIFKSLVPIIILFAIFMTFRRTGLFLTISTFLGFAIFIRQGRKIFLAFLFLLVLFFYFSTFHPLTKLYVTTRFNAHYLKSEIKINNRIKSVKVAFKMFRDKPIFGIGTRQYSRFFKSYTSDPTVMDSPDNQYLRFFAEGGLVGVLSFMLFIGFVVKELMLQARSMDGFSLLLSILNFSIGMLTLDAMYWPALLFTFWTICGLGMGNVERLRSQEIQ
ncbi:MAG: O-antigen ligase family protein [Elusimicrobia bacterium]|nr:O-antigen ligase family protein [Candidatus Obscuribacterium magneticum]